MIWERFAEASRPLRVAWLSAAALAAHATVLGGGYVWLDHAHVEAGLALRRPAEFLSLFRTPFAGTGYYRPLTALSLSLDALAGRPWVFHVVNLALHALAGILLVEACLVLGVRRRAATLGGLLFLAHPLTSLVAGAIAFRSEALVAAGLFGAIVAHRRGRPLLASLLLAAAALAKETGFVLAPLFVATIEWQRPTAPPVRWRLLAAEGAGLCLALALRLGFAPAWPSGFPLLSLSEHWGSRLALIARATTLLFLPVERGVCDAFPITGLLTPSALFGAALGIAFLVFAGRRGALGWLTILAFLPALQLVPTLRWWSPHYFYLGAGLFFVLIAERAAELGRGRFAWLALSALGLGALSWSDGRRYRNDDTLWAPEVAAEPACREGQFYLGEARRLAKDFDRARAHYEAALASRPGVLAFVDLDATLTNLGLVLFARRDFEGARRAFEAALRETESPRARRELGHDLGAVALASGDFEAAQRWLEPEAERSDALPESLLLWATWLEARGQPERAAQVRARAASSRR